MKYDTTWQHPNYYQLAIANELAELNENFAEKNRLKKIELKLSLTTYMDNKDMEKILNELA